MPTFNKLLAILKRTQSLPQPFYRLAVLAVFLACTGSGHLLNAWTGGRIAGQVKDATGAVIPNSQVVLTNAATGIKQIAITGNHGIFKG